MARASIHTAGVDVSDEEFEQERVSTLRVFEVKLLDGAAEAVTAHWHENSNNAGHLNFITIQKDGRRSVNDSFAYGSWTRLKELVGYTATTAANAH